MINTSFLRKFCISAVVVLLGLTFLLHGAGNAHAATLKVTHPAINTGTVHPNCNGAQYVISINPKGNRTFTFDITWFCGPALLETITLNYGDNHYSFYTCGARCQSGDTPTFTHQYDFFGEYFAFVTDGNTTFDFTVFV